MTVLRRHRRSDRRAHVKRMFVDLIGGGKAIDDPGSQLFDVLIVSQLRDDHGKFIAADPPAKFRAGTDISQPARDLGQQLVADLVTQGVVNSLEPIEVNHKESAAASTHRPP